MGILNPYFNCYELKAYLELNMIIIDNKIDIEIKIKEYSEILEKKEIEEHNYKKIKFHIELYKITETLKKRAEAVYATTLLGIIKLGSKEILKENKIKSRLKEMRNRQYIDTSEYLDEEFFKQKLIEELLNSNNSSELIKICTNDVNKEIKTNRKILEKIKKDDV